MRIPFPQPLGEAEAALRPRLPKRRLSMCSLRKPGLPEGAMTSGRLRPPRPAVSWAPSFNWFE